MVRGGARSAAPPPMCGRSGHAEAEDRDEHGRAHEGDLDRGHRVDLPVDQPRDERGHGSHQPVRVAGCAWTVDRPSVPLDVEWLVVARVFSVITLGASPIEPHGWWIGRSAQLRSVRGRSLDRVERGADEVSWYDFRGPCPWWLASVVPRPHRCRGHQPRHASGCHLDSGCRRLRHGRPRPQSPALAGTGAPAVEPAHARDDGSRAQRGDLGGLRAPRARSSRRLARGRVVPVRLSAHHLRDRLARRHPHSAGMEGRPRRRSRHRDTRPASRSGSS